MPDDEGLRIRLKRESMGVTIDTLTEEQVKYLASWNVGT
jgi:S-adenosylhomocysteine hydrolase